MKKGLFISILLLLAVFSVRAANNSVQANPLGIDKIYVFGDSLSDEGVADQRTDLPAGKAPTWTNTGGAIWPTDLAELLGISAPTANNQEFGIKGSGTFVSGNLNGTDYAAGGATTGSYAGKAAPSIYVPPALLTYTHDGVTQIGQIESYIKQNGTADPNGLYVIWSGSNDFLDLFPELIAHPDKAQQLITNTIISSTNNITRAVKLLHDVGAKHIIVVDLPDFADTPEVQSIAKFSPQLLPLVSGIGSTVRMRLSSLLGPAELGFKVIPVDVYGPLDEIFNTVSNGGSYKYSFNGTDYTITNVTDTACGPQGSSSNEAIVCQGFSSSYQNNYLFADDVHPTAQGHEIVANHIYTALQAAAANK